MNPPNPAKLPQAFAHGGVAFFCSAEPDLNGTFRPVVSRVLTPEDGGIEMLPQDTEAYASEPEALRHAEEQAVRWVREHGGGTRGQGA